MDLLLIIALGFSTSWLAIVLYSILIFPFVREETEYRSENDQNTFDNLQKNDYIKNTFINNRK